MSAPDLSTKYLGLELRSPWVVSSCPLTGELSTLLELEEAGAAAVVLPSLFQEQVEHWELEIGRLQATGADSHLEASNYFPELEDYNTGPDGTMRRIEEVRAALSIPVIASLNGVSREGWVSYARRIESAGADAIELNVFHLPTDPTRTAADVEAMILDEVAAVSSEVTIPVAVKLGSQLTAPANMAVELERAGAAGLVLFNRFLDPDIDLDTLEVVSKLELSRPSEVRLPLRWIGVLSAATKLSLAATSGLHNGLDAVKLLLAGADAVMVASTLLEHGIGHLEHMAAEARAWITEHEYDSVEQLKGSVNLANCPNPAAYGRLSYMRALTSFSST